MEERKHTAIKNPENVCFNCLKEAKARTIRIPEMGYGSGFDGWSTQIQLCDKCYQLTNPEWWQLNEVPLGEGWEDFFEFKYEKEIFEFVNVLPVEGKELFYNRYVNGWNARTWDAQDWIDYNLGILPHEKCKEYGCYSHQEIQAYKDRFPNCKHVEIKVYSDGSKGSGCYRGAHGDGDGNCGLNVWDECYFCDKFEERDGEIKIVDVQEKFYKRETQRLKDMITYAEARLAKIKNKTLTDND